MDRRATRTRKSRETDISVTLNLDGTRQIAVNTGFGMLDHMLELLAYWADMDLCLDCVGDLHIDAHHTVEDTGLVLGAALREALAGEGIARVGFGRVPMDESLAEVSLDFSGRPWLEWRGGELLPPVLAQQESDIWREFYKALATGARMNLHILFLYGKNGHHLLESVAKGAGIALAQAVTLKYASVRSTKGGLD